MIDISNINNVNWENTKISVLGAGKSGIAATRLALSMGAHVLISEYGDSINITTTQCLELETGGHSNKVLESDVIIISPGISDKIDIVLKCKELQIPIVSEIEFSSWFTTSPILAITGSNGKTTTTSLLFKMVENAGHNAMLGGNIGIPFSQNVFTERDLGQINTVHILELSSFQLENTLSFKPKIACILNLSEDHLDRYKNIDSYYKAKIKIAKNLDKNCFLLYNKKDSSYMNKITLNTRILEYNNKLKNSNYYIDKDNKSQTPLCIHRAPLGTHERFIGFLIEHFAGNFPLWLAPVQMVIIPISDKFKDYGTSIYNKLKDNNIRVQIDTRSETMGAKIRDAEINKIPIMIILGEKEVANKTISVRRRFTGNHESLILNEFVKTARDEIDLRILSKVNK